MIRRPIHPGTRVALGVVSVVLLLLGYSWLSHVQHQKNPTDTTIPNLHQLKEGVVSAFRKDRRSGERWIVEDTKASGQRFFLGLAYGFAGSLVLGMMMGCFAPVEAFCYPPLSLVAKVPPTAALAVFFVLAGTGTRMYTAMIAFGVLPTLAMAVYLAVKEFPEELQFKAYTLGASNSEVIWNTVLPYVLPRLLDATRLVIGPALVYLIAAEMVVGDVGYGYRNRLQSKLLNMGLVYPYLAILAGFGFAMDSFLRWLQQKWCPWFDSNRG